MQMNTITDDSWLYTTMFIKFNKSQHMSFGESERNKQPRSKSGAS